MVGDGRKEAHAKTFSHKVATIDSELRLSSIWRGSRGRQTGTGAGLIRTTIYFGILEARLISDLIL